MRVPLPLVALALLVLGSAAGSWGFAAMPDAGDAPRAGAPVVRSFAWDVTAHACNAGDGVCLAYDGQIPGPMLDVNLGDTVVITLTNRIAQTLPAGAPAHLAAAPVSFHVHGTSLSAAKDGVAAHEGTQLVESVAHPGGSFTYTFRAAFVGTWHYHDHVLGHDGAEGTKRGLFGGLVVRNGAEPRPAALLDMHVHDAAVNLGHGIAAPPLHAGDDIEILVAVLGNLVWDVTLESPEGATLARHRMGPGMSERIRIDDAQAGDYRWRAQWGPYVREGSVSVA